MLTLRDFSEANCGGLKVESLATDWLEFRPQEKLKVIERLCGGHSRLQVQFPPGTL
jgi:hypothetical protein